MITKLQHGFEYEIYIYINYKSLYKNIQGHTKFISKEGFVQFIINSHAPKSYILKHLLIDELIHI